MKLILDNRIQQIPTPDGVQVHDGPLVSYRHDDGYTYLFQPWFLDGRKVQTHTIDKQQITSSHWVKIKDSLWETEPHEIQFCLSRTCFFPTHTRIGQIYGMNSFIEKRLFGTAEDNREYGDTYHDGYQKIITAEIEFPALRSITTNQPTVILDHWQSEYEIRNSITTNDHIGVKGIGSPNVIDLHEIGEDFGLSDTRYIMFYGRFMHYHHSLEQELPGYKDGYPEHHAPFGMFQSEGILGFCMARSTNLLQWHKWYDNKWNPRAKGGHDSSLNPEAPIMFPHIHWNKALKRFVAIGQTTDQFGEEHGKLVWFTAENPFTWKYEGILPIVYGLYPALHPNPKNEAELVLTYTQIWRDDFRSTGLAMVRSILEE